jgi:hypothetical protein
VDSLRRKNGNRRKVKMPCFERGFKMLRTLAERTKESRMSRNRIFTFSEANNVALSFLRLDE